MRVSLEELEHEAVSTLRHCDTLEEERNELTAQASSLYAEIATIKVEIEGNQERIDEIRGTPYSREEREELQEANRDSRARKQELYEGLKEAQRRKAEVNRSIHEVRRQLASLRNHALTCLKEVRTNTRRSEEALRLAKGRPDVSQLHKVCLTQERQLQHILDTLSRRESRLDAFTDETPTHFERENRKSPSMVQDSGAGHSDGIQIRTFVRLTCFPEHTDVLDFIEETLPPHIRELINTIEFRPQEEEFVGQAFPQFGEVRLYENLNWFCGQFGLDYGKWALLHEVGHIVAEKAPLVPYKLARLFAYGETRSTVPAYSRAYSHAQYSLSQSLKLSGENRDDTYDNYVAKVWKAREVFPEAFAAFFLDNESLAIHDSELHNFIADLVERRD